MMIEMALDRSIPRDASGVRTANRLLSLVNITLKGADPDAEFFYLGGPMSGIRQFNFPRFREVATALRENGYNIVSPAELDDAKLEAAALASDDGVHDTTIAPYEEYLGRDLMVCALPTCVGMICLEGWEHSRGARGESWLISFLGKQLFEYRYVDGGHGLLSIERDERLHALGVPDYAAGAVPTDEPGKLTTAARRTSVATYDHPLALDTLGPIGGR